MLENPPPEIARPWLLRQSWEVVCYLNTMACEKGHAQYGHTSDGYEKTKALWESEHGKVMPLVEAIELCCKAHRLAPFLNFNGNTFAGIARAMSEELVRGLPRAAVKIFSSAIGHYVAGTASRSELDGVLEETLARLPQSLPNQ